ncbi:hypothetical protein D3C72_1402540 [compost metagenome]
MEADHGGLLVQQDRQLGLVGQEALVDLGQRLGRRGVERGEDRAQAVDPDAVARRIGRRRRMAEQVHVERPRRQGLQRLNLTPSLDRIDRGDGDGAQRPGVRHGRRQFGRGGPGHRGLNDRQIEAQAVGEGGLHGGFLTCSAAALHR